MRNLERGNAKPALGRAMSPVWALGWVGGALIALTAGLLAWWCFSTRATGNMLDFEAVYFGSRCLIVHQDPYQEVQFQNVFEAERGEVPAIANGPNLVRVGVFRCVNLPTSLFLLIPFALLPWGTASTLWMTLTIASLSLAAFLAWRMGAETSPGLALFLGCFLLLNCKVVCSDGNASGMAVGLCLIGAYCLLRDRFVWAGMVCLAMSLLLKPHTTGAVWLFFLLAGGVWRRRALETLALTAGLGLAAVVMVWQVSPHWLQELGANLAVSGAPGAINDPAPPSVDGHSVLAMINLQTVVSVFRNDAWFYNQATYLVCGVLLPGWGAVTLRSRLSVPSARQGQAWVGLAAIAALSMLPLYHRVYDAKMLLLAIPACCLLAAEGGVVGWLALGLTTAAIVLTADVPLMVLSVLTRGTHLSMTTGAEEVWMVLLDRPIPLMLLVLGCFYLWIYAGRLRRAEPASR